MPSASARDDVTLLWVSPEDPETIAAVVSLADRNKATLGPMPRGAFPDFAAQQNLLAATAGDGSVLGYSLFAIAKGRVRLIHLCVEPTARRQGLAGMLINAIRAQYPDVTGIRLKCRADFEAHKLWARLGFSAVNEVMGRGKNPKTLTVWWLSNNRPDLFSTLTEDDQALAVAVDHNIFIDLEVDRNRSGSHESQALEADWLQGHIRLTRTAETLNEILRIPDPKERERQRSAAFRFGELEHSPDDFNDASGKLRAEIGNVAPEDQSDLNHVLHAAAGGAAVFVTRDSDLIARLSDAAFRVLDLRILRPSELIVHLDEIQNAERYRPAALQGTAFLISETRAGYESNLAHLLNISGGEKGSAYRTTLRDLAVNPASRCHQIQDPNNKTVAAWATVPDLAHHTLSVPLLRVSASRLSETIASLIVGTLKREALRQRFKLVQIDDRYPSQPFRQLLVNDGFVQMGSTWRAFVLDVRTSGAAYNSLPDYAAAKALLAPSDRLDAQITGDLEHALWPAKLLDSTIPSYLIPIQPRWAYELLGLRDSLWDRAPLLGLSREHIYYRSSRANPRVPARILWYASGSGRDRINAVVACSLLVEVTTDSPARLHERFRHLGVYRLRDVESRSNGVAASALRFVDTETFAHPVTFARLRELHGKRRIAGDVFGSVYEEGVRRR